MTDADQSAAVLKLNDSDEAPPQPKSVVAVFYSPDAAPLISGLVGKLQRVARYRRNSRALEYMRILASSELGPGTEFVVLQSVARAAHDLTAGRIQSADQIVLLWPDAIGYGWWPVERAVFAAKSGPAEVTVITGRQRQFRASTQRALTPFRWRRVMERLWLGEIVFAATLLMSAPFLAAWDAVRGRR